MKNTIPALISGLLLAISWPTYGVPFFIFVALVPLMLAEHNISLFSAVKRKGWTVFGLSFLTFIVWNIVTTGWLYNSRNPDGSHALAAVVLPVIANSLLYATVFTAYHWFKRVQGTYWGLAFLVALWMAFEKFHLSWEFTWPWLNLGNAFSEYPKLIQWYDTLGATGGSFWILLVNVFIFYTVRTWAAGRKRRALIKNLAVAALAITLPMLISWMKYRAFSARPTGEVSVLMLQPELDPYNEKYQKDSLTITTELLRLADEGARVPVDFYIGPETSLPGSGSFSETGLKNSQVLMTVNSFLQRHPESVLATGISSHRFYRDKAQAPVNAYQLNPDLWVESYNTAMQTDASGAVQLYHKGKLVPGVEIFPYIDILKPMLGNAMLNFGGTVASLGTDKERKVFSNSHNAGKMAPIICYESIYGEYVTGYVKNGANFLAIMTNDSWWGVSQGHRQLLSYARLRAIETRREIARAANSGISAHINALGEVVEDTLYGDRTALFTKIKLYEGQTFYARTGDLLSRICIFALGFLIFYTIINRFQERKKRTAALPQVAKKQH